MGKEYQMFVHDLSQLPEDKEVLLNVTELESFKSIAVKAIVSSKEGEGDLLWLRYPRGQVREKPWRIKIIEEVPLEYLFIKSSALD